MRKNIDLNLLRCFEALLTHQNVSRAARHMGITQPSMSHALSRLRVLFDDPLFIHAHGVMAPTARATSLSDHVRDVLMRADALLVSADEFEPGTARLEFTLMAAEYVECVLLPRLLARLRQEAPGVSLRFQAADRSRAFELLERGSVDFRLAWWTEPAKTLRSTQLFTDRFVCIARVGHPAVRDGAMSEKHFLEAAHVALEPVRSGLSYQAVESAFRRRDRTRHVAVHVQSALSLCGVVAESDLIASLPARFADRMMALFPIQTFDSPFPVGVARQSIYWHERTHKLASHRWFRSLVTSVAREDWPRSGA